MAALGLALGLPFVAPRGGSALARWLSGATYADWNPGLIASLAQNSDGTGAVASNGDSVGRVLDQGAGGFNATQATAAARPTYQGGALRSNGTTRHLITAYTAGASGNCILIKAIISGTPGSGRWFAGAEDAASANRFYLGVSSVGLVTAGIGSNTGSTHIGSRDLRSKTAVIAVSADGTTVRLFAYADGSATQEDSDTQGGAPTTATPIYLHCLNSNGSAGGFTAMDLVRVIAARKAMTLAEFTAIAPTL